MRVFDTSSGQCLWTLNPEASAADLVAFSGKYICSAHADRLASAPVYICSQVLSLFYTLPSSVQIWAFEKGRPIHKHALHGHTMPVTVCVLISYYFMGGELYKNNVPIVSVSGPESRHCSQWVLGWIPKSLAVQQRNEQAHHLCSFRGFVLDY